MISSKIQATIKAVLEANGQRTNEDLSEIISAALRDSIGGSRYRLMFDSCAEHPPHDQWKKNHDADILHSQLLRCNDEMLIRIWENRLLWGITRGLTANEINHGWCHEWAEMAAQRFPDAIHMLYRTIENGHSFIRIGDRFYDAECLYGVENWVDLPLFHHFYSEIQAGLAAEGISEVTADHMKMYYAVQDKRIERIQRSRAKRKA